MLITVRVLRLLVGLIAVWQILGLLPVLTTWLPNPHQVTGGMWAIAFIKLMVMLVCGGIYFWLGKIKSRIASPEKSSSEGRIIIYAVLGLLAIGIVFAIAVPAFSEHSAHSTVAATASQIPVTPSTLESDTPTYISPPNFESEGWTQESTGSTESGPWLKYDPPGTRYYRDAQRVIYRVFPPGVRPSGQRANPFGLMDSTDRPPQ